MVLALGLGYTVHGCRAGQPRADAQKKFTGTWQVTPIKERLTINDCDATQIEARGGTILVPYPRQVNSAAL